MDRTTLFLGVGTLISAILLIFTAWILPDDQGTFTAIVGLTSGFSGAFFRDVSARIPKPAAEPPATEPTK